MVEKKEGNTMTCKNCDTDLICRIKKYKGNYEDAPQWQNYDGTAHYSTNDGKNFTCNIPQDDEAQEATTQETIVETNTSSNVKEENIDSVKTELDRNTALWVSSQSKLLREFTYVVKEDLLNNKRPGDQVDGAIVWVRAQTIYQRWCALEDKK